MARPEAAALRRPERAREGPLWRTSGLRRLLALAVLALLLAPTTALAAAVPLPSPRVPSEGRAGARPVSPAAPGPLTWSDYLPTNVIPERAFSASATFRALGNGLAMVVGGTGRCGVFCNDSWELNFNDPSGPTWFQGAVPGNQGLIGASLAYDAADGALVLFGGLNGTSGILNRTWTEVPYRTSWVAGPSRGGPSARWSASMAYDPALGGLILFGGAGPGGSLYSDTWLFRGGSWSPVVSAAVPAARSGATLTWQASPQRLILFGGNGSTGPLSDTWAFSGEQWYPLHPASSPSARANASSASDGEGDPLVAMGRGPSGWLNDAWVLVGDNWTAPAVATPAPEPLEGAVLLPNLGATANDLALLWGTNGTGVQRAMWGLRLANGGSPPAPSPLQVLDGASPSSGSAPLTVEFHAYGTEGTPPYTYRWDFGDATPVSTLGSPTHTYSRPGHYLAALLVQDSALTPQTFSTTVPVTVSAPPGGFNATASAIPDSGPLPLSVSFLTSISGGTAPYTTLWSFGDGSPRSHAADPTHAYNLSGSFAALLTVNDSSGRTASWVDTIVVRGTGLAVALNVAPTTGLAPLGVTLNASVRGGPAPYHFLWDFGDANGTSGFIASVTHTYDSPGVYDARVTVVDADGQNATASATVTVGALPPFVPPPPTLLQKVAGAVVGTLEFLLEPLVLGPILLVAFVAGAVQWGRVQLPLRRAVRRAAGRPRRSDLWGVAEVALLVGELRRGSSWRRILRKLRPLLLRDARRAAGLIAWKPGQDATWALRRALLLPPQLLLAGTALFVGLFVLPNCELGPPIHPLCPVGVGSYFQTLGAFLVGLFTSWSTDAYLQAYLPYTLQLLGVVVLLSALLSYPLGLLAGWHRGRIVDQATRGASVLAFSIPIFVVSLLTFGAIWTWYFDVTAGDSIVGSLPSVTWLVQNMGGFPPWIALHENTLPTGFVLIDAPLHGAWAFEEVVLLKMLLQGLPIAALYSAIFLRYVRLATEEASTEPSLVGARARGLSERTLLWKHTSRRISPIYVSIFGTTFPTLLFVQMVAEWVYGDLGIGRSFLVALGDPVDLARVAFVVLVLIFVVNFLGDAAARLLDPSGRNRAR